MSRLVITSGRVIDPVNRIDQHADVVVEAGRIVSVGPNAGHGRDDKVLDASGCIVSPGLIDLHVHLREPGGEQAETIASGAAAAIDGGFTTVCCMPNTDPPVDRAAMIGFIYGQADWADLCRVFPVGAISHRREGQQLAELALMAEAGAIGFSDDGDVVEQAGLMKKALQNVARTGKVLMQHCQEPSLTVNAVLNAGPTATHLGLVGWPAVAEEIIIERDIRLNRDIACKYHVQHLSCAGSVEIVRQARADGQPVTAEASPHHLLLTESACDGYDTMAKMNPPLRRQEDVDALRAGIKDGTITILATDHAPHTRDAKAVEFDSAPFGIVGLETALALYVKALIETETIDWPTLIAMMTANPARICGLDGPPHLLGSLSPGSPADLTIIDLQEQWTIDTGQFKGRSINTPFDGWTVRGRAIAVIVGGRVKFDRQSRFKG